MCNSLSLSRFFSSRFALSLLTRWSTSTSFGNGEKITENAHDMRPLDRRDLCRSGNPVSTSFGGCSSDWMHTDTLDVYARRWSLKLTSWPTGVLRPTGRTGPCKQRSYDTRTLILQRRMRISFTMLRPVRRKNNQDNKYPLPDTRPKTDSLHEPVQAAVLSHKDRELATAHTVALNGPRFSFRQKDRSGATKEVAWGPGHL